MLCTALLLCLLGSTPASRDTAHTPATPPGTRSAPTPPADFSGRQGNVEIPLPRIEATVVVDGNLDEPVWQQASRLKDFSRYAPTDGDAADDSTEVFVWYSPTALHVGVRAYAQPGTVRATLADRDKMFNDDYIGIFLGTFNDGRQATVFSANPFGIQGDGIIAETGQGSSGFGGLAVGREATDVSPDYVYQSKGRLTEYGYEIEFRIPFKSLTYQPTDVQQWSFNVMRRVQSRGYEYSWAPAKRAAASYIRQHGHLTGLQQLSRGLVLDVTPVVTRQVDGKPTPAGYGYSDHPFKFGANVRWGITNNLTMNGTVQPDFAEVESDANQLVTDPRQAVRFAERRPFFVDGIEQFNVPSGLVYTRRIIQPVAATKLTGKIAGTTVAVLAAVDDTLNSFSGHDRPFFGIVRVQRDFTPAARLGVIYTGKEEGDAFNRVAGADLRINVRKIWSAQLQSVWSSTANPTTKAFGGPLWSASVSRQGRKFGARYLLNGIDTDFRTASGFISRPAIAHMNVDHRYTLFGKNGAFLENTTFDLVMDGTWKYQNFVDGRDALEKKLHTNVNFAFRGGWRLGTSYLLETFGYDPALFAGYAIERQQGAVFDTIPFTGVGRLFNRDYVISLATPQFKHFGFNGLFIWGRDDNFNEWASSDIGYYSLTANWRPSPRMRIDGTYLWSFFDRPSDDTRTAQTRIPRIKAEYQVSRAFFVRLVGQYTSQERDALRDDSRTNFPILIRNAKGVYVKTTKQSQNLMNGEVLLSYVPSPGKVFYAGYRSVYNEPRPFAFESMIRQSDGFFVKVSYLFRAN
ncbi:MAG: DUF5916 domain-containing protein [Gemmatimonas sp.]